MGKTQKFSKQSEVVVEAQEAFDWHARPGAFARLAPPWTDVRMLTCLLYTSPSPRDVEESRMPSSA